MRLRQTTQELGDKVRLVWRSFPLVPHEIPGNRISAHSVQGRLRAGQAEPECGIAPWSGERYPTSSMPALEAARCAARQDAEAFDRYDMALFRAFFCESKDISDRSVLVGLAEGVGLDVTRFERDLETGLEHQIVLDDYREALEKYGSMALGIPLMVLNGGYPLVGALPVEMYRRAVRKALGQQD